MSASVVDAPLRMRAVINTIGDARAVLIEPSPRTREEIYPKLCSLGYEVVEREHSDPLCDAGVVVVEADRSALMIDTVRSWRCGLGAGAILIGITSWWTDDEPELRTLADAVLHAPLRPEECRVVLSAIPAAAPMMAGPISP